MKIFIITMEDPIYTLPFIKKIIDARQNDIIGLATTKGNRLTISKKRSKVTYLFSLLLIMGFIHFVKYTFITLWFKIKLKLSKIFKFIESPSIINYANKKNIKTYQLKSPNNSDFLLELRKLQPDLIINQSQSILKNEILSIPIYGVINRHNALLPKNRGRLTPFWVLYKKEKETGVSIHFVEEGIDSGDIIVQEKFLVNKNDNFNTLVKKNYKVAIKAILKALDLIEQGNYKLIKNDDENSSYNSTPTIKDAIKYRLSKLKLK